MTMLAFSSGLPPASHKRLFYPMLLTFLVLFICRSTAAAFRLEREMAAPGPPRRLPRAKEARGADVTISTARIVGLPASMMSSLDVSRISTTSGSSGSRSRSRLYSWADDGDGDDDWFGEKKNDGNSGDDETGRRKPDDLRVESMRSLLESSWDGDAMGMVPSGPEKSAEAAAESVAAAMAQGHNIIMIDLRLPSYDITEGSKFYDIVACYDFCVNLSNRLRDRKLISKSLLLVRNEDERAKVDPWRDGAEEKRRGRSRVEGGGASASSEKWGFPGEASAVVGESNESSDVDVDAFRKQLMSSWESSTGNGDKNEESIPESPQEDAIDSEGYIDARKDNKSSYPVSSTAPVTSGSAQSAGESHRLWSMLGNEEISSGADMFDQVIAAVDINARLIEYGGVSTIGGEDDNGLPLELEDALILLSPYDTADIVGVRRIVGRYGRSRTIVLVNSRMGTLPKELDTAVLAYGLLPLMARPKGDEEETGAKVVVMRRFPKDWEVFVDVDGEGFVDAVGEGGPFTLGNGASNEFPTIEWIVKRVQAHVQSLFGRQ